MSQTEETKLKTPIWGKVILILVIVGVVLAAFFGFRTVRSFIRIQRAGLHPGATDVESIRGWMTVPYIAKAYQVPPDYIFQQIGVPPQGNERSSLADLNYKYFYGQQGLVLEKVKAAVQLFQNEHPTPPGPPAPAQ
jgi:hypothetical protein